MPLEVIGNPTGYFVDKSGKVEYRTIGFVGEDANRLVRKMDEVLTNIRHACDEIGAVIYWRRALGMRSEQHEDSVFTGRMTLSCRIATIPDLPESVWIMSGWKKECEMWQTIGGDE